MENEVLDAINVEVPDHHHVMTFVITIFLPQTLLLAYSQHILIDMIINIHASQIIVLVEKDLTVMIFI